jgi:hypothetical protein
MPTCARFCKNQRWTLNRKSDEKLEISKQKQKAMDLTFPGSDLVSHFTKSRSRFPFLSVIVTSRFRGAVRGQSGHLVSCNAPDQGHERREDVPEFDIYRWHWRASSPEKKKKKREGRMEGAIAEWLGRDEGSGDALFYHNVSWISCGSHTLWGGSHAWKLYSGSHAPKLYSGSHAEVDKLRVPLSPGNSSVKPFLADKEKCWTRVISTRRNAACKLFFPTTLPSSQFIRKPSHVGYKPWILAL